MGTCVELPAHYSNRKNYPEPRFQLQIWLLKMRKKQFWFNFQNKCETTTINHQTDTKILKYILRSFHYWIVDIKPPYISVLNKTIFGIYTKSLISGIKKCEFFAIDLRIFVQIRGSNYSSFSNDSYPVFLWLQFWVGSRFSLFGNTELYLPDGRIHILHSARQL